MQMTLRTSSSTWQSTNEIANLVVPSYGLSLVLYEAKSKGGYAGKASEDRSARACFYFPTDYARPSGEDPPTLHGAKEVCESHLSGSHVVALMEV